MFYKKTYINTYKFIHKVASFIYKNVFNYVLVPLWGPGMGGISL